MQRIFRAHDGLEEYIRIHLLSNMTGYAKRISPVEFKKEIFSNLQREGVDCERRGRITSSADERDRRLFASR